MLFDQAPEEWELHPKRWDVTRYRNIRYARMGVPLTATGIQIDNANTPTPEFTPPAPEVMEYGRQLAAAQDTYYWKVTRIDLRPMEPADITIKPANWKWEVKNKYVWGFSPVYGVNIRWLETYFPPAGWYWDQDLKTLKQVPTVTTSLKTKQLEALHTFLQTKKLGRR